LQLHERRPGALPCLPPVIGIEWRVASGTNARFGVPFHETTKQAAEASRMICHAHHDYRAESAFVAPTGKDPGFVVGADDGPRDLLGGSNSERLELPNRPRTCILVRYPSSDELLINGVRRIGEHRDSGSNAGLDEVGSFEHSCSIRIARHDNDVGTLDRITGDQRPPRCSQKRLSQRHCRSGAEQQDQDQGTQPRTSGCTHRRRQRFVRGGDPCHSGGVAARTERERSERAQPLPSCDHCLGGMDSQRVENRV